jgi:hypothetical protein
MSFEANSPYFPASGRKFPVFRNRNSGIHANPLTLLRDQARRPVEAGQMRPDF